MYFTLWNKIHVKSKVKHLFLNEIGTWSTRGQLSVQWHVFIVMDSLFWWIFQTEELPVQNEIIPGTLRSETTSTQILFQCLTVEKVLRDVVRQSHANVLPLGGISTDKGQSVIMKNLPNLVQCRRYSRALVTMSRSILFRSCRDSDP